MARTSETDQRSPFGLDRYRRRDTAARRHLPRLQCERHPAHQQL